MQQEPTMDNSFEDDDLLSLKNITQGLMDEGLQLHDDQNGGIMNEFNYDDEYSLGYSNNPMLMVMRSILGDNGQGRNNMAGFPDIHALATANLISQTQEAIMQEYNIDFENPDYFGADYTQLEPVIPPEINMDNTDHIHVDGHIDRFTPMELVSDHNIEERGFLQEISDLATAFNDTNEEKILDKESVKKQDDESVDHFTTVHEISKDLSDKLLKTDESISRTKPNQEIVLKQKRIRTRVAQVKVDENSEGTVCELCGKVFRNRKGLHNHQTCHSPLQCPVSGCERTFNYPSHYKYHLLTHSQERNFSCECGKVFYTSQQLEIHQRTHTLDKPFNCDKCGKSFTTAGNLKNHQRLHTGEKPYTCTVNDCNKSFAEISSLKKHQLTHSGEKPYKCTICNKGFTQSSSRSYHMKHKHADQSVHQETTSSLVTLNRSSVT